MRKWNKNTERKKVINKQNKFSIPEDYIFENKIFKETVFELIENILDLKIKYIISKNIKKFDNISAYEFYILELKIKFVNNKVKNIYLKFIENDKIKESIFCYWSLLYEQNKLLNRVTITPVNIDEYKKSVLLQEDNKQETKQKTIIHFINFNEYLKKNKCNSYIFQNINKKQTLLLGINNK